MPSCKISNIGSKTDASKVYIFLERYINDGSPSGFTKNVNDIHSAQRGKESFKLPIYSISYEEGLILGPVTAKWALPILNSNHIPLPIHPDVEHRLLNEKTKFDASPVSFANVAPTSSGRTVFVDENPPHFIKLHYPYELGRFSRDLHLYKWLSALENSRELQHEIRNFPPELAFLPESAGTYWEGNAENRGFGAIIRDYEALPKLSSSPKLLVPGFSMIFGGAVPSIAPPLIRQVLQGPTTEAEQLNRFLDLLVLPLVRSFCFLSTQIGLIPEMHAQNVLFEYDTKEHSVRVVLRDLGDMFKDYAVRRDHSKHVSFCSYKSIEPAKDRDLFQRRSFAYDFKLGEYLLFPLGRRFASEFGISPDIVFGAMREAARYVWNKWPGYFRGFSTWYDYPREKSVGRDDYRRRRHPKFR